MKLELRVSRVVSHRINVTTLELQVQIDAQETRIKGGSVQYIAATLLETLEKSANSQLSIPPQTGWSLLKDNGNSKQFKYPGIKFGNKIETQWLVLSERKLENTAVFDSVEDYADPFKDKIQHKILAIEVTERTIVLQKKYGVVLEGLPSVGPDHDPRYLPTSSHIAKILECHPEFKGIKVHRSSFLRKFVLEKDGAFASFESLAVDVLPSLVSIWKDKDISKSKIMDALEILANKNTKDELKDYFTGLRWDKVPRIESWLIDYLGANDNSVIRTVGKKWLIAGVARALNVDEPSGNEGVLLLVGQKGLGKSQTFRLLAPQQRWYSDSHLDISENKKIAEVITGKFIHENAELAGWTRRENEAIKNFITAQVDDFRGSYQRQSESVVRRTIFGASSNHLNVLTDLTGNRRIWVVEVRKSLDQEAFKKIVPQLWAEAKVLYKSGESQFLSGSQIIELEEYGQKFEQVDTAVEALSSSLDQYFEAADRDDPKDIRNKGMISSSDLHVFFDKVGIRSNSRKGEAMRSLGFENKTIYVGNKICKAWVKNETSNSSS